jgi:phenylalanyl-tRNA synthetase beta chain
MDLMRWQRLALNDMAISMKTSRAWLQKYFTEDLPSVDALADALTFHVAEIEEVVGEMLDVNILPDRAAYMLCHRGIAKEISAICELPLKNDPLRTEVVSFPTTSSLTVSIEDETQCLRYMGGVVRGVKVGASPAWLKEALESVGQRSINNVVDATNYVMLDIGQPLHAFDAAKLTEKEGTYSIRVRGAYEESITTLTGETYTLPEGTLLITDAHANAPIGIAGIKGGMPAAITHETKDIIVESANFEGTLVRKASQRLKLWTDASQRFQNRPSPELAAYAMREVLELITRIAGGEVEGVVDVYPAALAGASAEHVSVSLSKINSVLGTALTLEDVEKVFDRLGFTYSVLSDVLTVTPPFERRDLKIEEDLLEEVVRIIGFDQVESAELPPYPHVVDQDQFRGLERIKDMLASYGFVEISSPSFAAEGEVILMNPIDTTRPALRPTLKVNLRDALTRAKSVGPRVFGVAKEVKLFEIGTVFTNGSEHFALALGIEALEGKVTSAVIDEVLTHLTQWGAIASAPALAPGELIIEVSLQNLVTIGEGYAPQKISLSMYKPFSIYPSAIRDIAVWTPERTERDEVANIIIAEAGELLARIDLFDRFTKTVDEVEKISYAFRLVFESFEKTLSDEDLNPIMEKITMSLNAREGWNVR